MANRLLLGPSATNTLTKICIAYQDTITKNFVTQNPGTSPSIQFHPIFGLRGLVQYQDLLDLDFNNKQDTFRSASVSRYLSNSKIIFSLPVVQNAIGFCSPKYEIIEENNYRNCRNELDQALDLIKKYSPWIHDLFAQVVFDIIFTQKNGEYLFVGGGGSSYKLLGLLFMSFRPISQYQAYELAISIAHELGHNCFFLLQAGERPLHEDSINLRVYSGVRGVKRPVYASLQALVALAYMLSFSWDAYNATKMEDDPELKAFLKVKVTEYRQGLEKGLESMQDVKFSDLGKVVIFEFLELKRRVEL